jgi:hypothetical protein
LLAFYWLEVTRHSLPIAELDRKEKEINVEAFENGTKRFGRSESRRPEFVQLVGSVEVG